MPGVADESFGIHVGKLAQLPNSVIKRAREVVRGLRQKEGTSSQQMSIYQPAQEIVETPSTKLYEVQEIIESINFDDVSPRQAWDLLWELREKMR